MKFIKEYWFGLLISIIMTVFILIFLLVAISPHTDAKNRGFIPCSTAMVDKIANCHNNKVLCILNTVSKGNICYAKVILKGLIDFAKGEQKTPWENYLFTPEEQAEDNSIYPDDETMEQILQEHPDLLDSFEQIKEQNAQLMQKIDEKEKEINDGTTNSEPAEMGSF